MSRFIPLFVGVMLVGCAGADAPVGAPPEVSLDRGDVRTPPLTSIDVAGRPERLWPFVSANLASTDDPVNLVLAGRADPRSVRRALLALDGNRGGPFPPVFPFTCVWSDAIGGLMAAYGAESRWAGGAIQLQCGEYGPIRFHLRLFDLGSVTVANAHFEVVIPGTADHQVLSWELAEQLVAYDLARTGLLGAPPATTELITPAPTHRVIPAPIYNGLPADLRMLIGGPPLPASDVGIANDGRATVMTLAGEASSVAPRPPQTLTITYDQVIPKPFCAAGPGDLVLVQGPVTLEQATSDGAEYRSSFRASGQLTVTPIDGSTGQPAGPPLRASVSEWQRSSVDRRGGAIRGMIRQSLLLASTVGAGTLQIGIAIAPGQEPRYERLERCGVR